jgi:hypothetical protein
MYLFLAIDLPQFFSTKLTVQPELAFVNNSLDKYFGLVRHVRINTTALKPVFTCGVKTSKMGAIR